MINLSHRHEVIRMLFSIKVNSLTEEVSRLDIDDDMGLGGDETMECKCGMPLCICVAPSKSTDKPNPPVKSHFLKCVFLHICRYLLKMLLEQATIAHVALPQLKSEISAKSKGSSSSSNARYVSI